MQNTGHGHVFPRPDGLLARCGGPSVCGECAKDLARKNIIDDGYKGTTPTAAPDIEAMIRKAYSAYLAQCTITREDGRAERQISFNEADLALRTALAAGAKAAERVAELEAAQIPTPPAGMHYELVKDGTTPRQRANHKRHARHIAIIMNKGIE